MSVCAVITMLVNRGLCRNVGIKQWKALKSIKSEKFIMERVFMSKGIILVIIMISCGIIGGLTVYISDFKNKFILNELIEKILYAVIASFLVPLFLNTISSNLINEIGTTIQSTYIDPVVHFLVAPSDEVQL